MNNRDALKSFKLSRDNVRFLFQNEHSFRMGCRNNNNANKDTHEKAVALVHRSNNGGLDQYNGHRKQNILMMPHMQNPSDLGDLIPKTTKYEKGRLGCLGEWGGY